MAERTRIDGMGDEIKGDVKEDIGKLTGNRRTEAEGILDQAKGAFEQGAADLMDKVDAVEDEIRGDTSR